MFSLKATELKDLSFRLKSIWGDDRNGTNGRHSCAALTLDQRVSAIASNENLQYRGWLEWGGYQAFESIVGIVGIGGQRTPDGTLALMRSRFGQRANILGRWAHIGPTLGPRWAHVGLTPRSFTSFSIRERRKIDSTLVYLYSQWLCHKFSVRNGKTKAIKILSIILWWNKATNLRSNVLLLELNSKVDKIWSAIQS